MAGMFGVAPLMESTFNATRTFKWCLFLEMDVKVFDVTVEHNSLMIAQVRRTL